MSQGPAKATVKLTATANNTPRGEVTFTTEAGGVKVSGSFSGLGTASTASISTRRATARRPTPRRPAATSTPAPSRTRRATRRRHAGDLGNLKADPYGLARVDFVDPLISLSGENSIIGKAVIIHEKADDFTTQPTGNAGARQACGVIEAAK